MKCIAVDGGTGAVTATEDASCTGSQFVLLTQSELDVYMASPFRMSVADGAALSGLILAVWVSALVGRFLIRVVRSDAEPTQP
jgi:hypothetical protein